MNKKVMIIMNPKAGKGTAKTSLFTICNHISKRKDIASVFVTQQKGHAKDLVLDYATKYDLLLCIGGDGTWNEIINGVMQLTKKPQLAYLPSGTVNDFAATLQLPKSASKLLTMMDANILFQCDIGLFNNHYFTYVAAFGVFTEVSYTTPQQKKNMFGKVAYFLEGIKQLTKITSYHVTIDTAQEHIEDDFIFGCITNTKYVGGFTTIGTKFAELDDGLFEVLFIRMPQNPLDVQTIVASLLKQEINDHFMHFIKTDKISIISDQEIQWTLDGEDGGHFDRVSIENKNKAITIMV